VTLNDIHQKPKNTTRDNKITKITYAHYDLYSTRTSTSQHRALNKTDLMAWVPRHVQEAKLSWNRWYFTLKKRQLWPFHQKFQF